MINELIKSGEIYYIVGVLVLVVLTVYAYFNGYKKQILEGVKPLVEEAERWLGSKKGKEKLALVQKWIMDKITMTPPWIQWALILYFENGNRVEKEVSKFIDYINRKIREEEKALNKIITEEKKKVIYSMPLMVEEQEHYIQEAESDNHKGAYRGYIEASLKNEDVKAGFEIKGEF